MKKKIQRFTQHRGHRRWRDYRGQCSNLGSPQDPPGRSIESTSGVALHKAEEKVLRMAEPAVVAMNRVMIEEQRAGGFNRA